MNRLLIASEEKVVHIPLDKVCYTDVSYNKELDKFVITIGLSNSEVLKFVTSYGNKPSQPPTVKCLELANSKDIVL